MSTKETNQRVRFVDIARGLAVLLMIAVHGTDAFLSDVYRTGWLYHQISILFGFVAPVFIFFSGFTLQIALQKRAASNRSSRDLVFRAVEILLLGYWLQIPSHSLSIALNATGFQADRFFDCNVLGLIAVSMLVLLALNSLLGKLQRTITISLAIGAVVVVVTPFIQNALAIQSLPLFFRFYLSPEGSFPLFPWAAYFFVGFGLAKWLVGLSTEPSFANVSIAVGLLLMVVARCVGLIDYELLDSCMFWQDGPLLFLFRLGGIVVVAGFAQRLAQMGPRVAWLDTVGQVSLLIYVLHLMLIYGSPITMGMRYWFDGMLNRALDPAVVLLLIALVGVVVWGAVMMWRRFRTYSPKHATWLARAWWIGFAMFFLVVS